MSGIINDNVGRSSGLMKAAGGGKLLQVLETTDASVVSGNSATPAGCGLLQAITPTAAGSKFLVTMWTGCHSSGQKGNISIYFDIDGGGYAVVTPIGAAVGSRNRAHVFQDNVGDTAPMHFSIVHTPSYTLGQVITYQIFMEVYQSGYAHNMGRTQVDSNSDLYGRNPSGIRVEEIGA